MNGSIRLDLIGAFRATAEGQDLVLPPSGARLLALLVLHRHGLTRSCVAGRLWPDKSEERAAANLRSTLWRMKGTRAVALDSREPAALRIGPDVMVDLDEVHQRDASEPGAAEPLLCDLLPGWDDPWLTPFRIRWRQVRLHILDRTCRRLLDEARYAEAAALAGLVLGAEPLRESMVRLLVEANLGLGRSSAAAAAITCYQDRLGHELAAHASPQLHHLAGQLLSQIDGCAPVTPRCLGPTCPHDTTISSKEDLTDRAGEPPGSCQRRSSSWHDAHPR